MCKMGVDQMIAVNNKITKVINSSQSKITTAQAQTILRNCGILNKNNQVKSAYKNIVVETSASSDGRK